MSSAQQFLPLHSWFLRFILINSPSLLEFNNKAPAFTSSISKLFNSSFVFNVSILLFLVKTIRKREINFILLNSSDTLVAVLGTKKIYYFNTKTWKLFHKIASMENRKYRGINATKDDKIVVIADEKTLEIYVNIYSIV